ncbi:hypothetical protein Syun_015507 [Stephania yunnanensis]|uniref:Uncharacterized protein n=1 Tax=Stephania yunnanensis TaxID=152371 RepID=A0AAP0P9S5_9MAGN
MREVAEETREAVRGQGRDGRDEGRGRLMPAGVEMGEMESRGPFRLLHILQLQMDELCKELDDVKAQLEKLKEENQSKTELSERFRKVHDEQLTKIKEARVENEKQAQELIAKEAELSVTKQLNEELRYKLNEKESALRHVGSANDRLRADLGEKLQKLEQANRDLVLALDEADMKNKEQEQTIRTSKEEIHGLKALLSNAEKKCLEAEQKATFPKELRQRDDHLMKLEEEEIKIKDKLKWKKEQFEHLEQAHRKIQEQFRTSKKEWEQEKAKLIDDLCSLQTKLDSQTRVSESLRNQLQMCNQALANEESRRKLLEFQISETKKCYENVFTECQEAQAKIESLTARRDEEISSLRHTLCIKETHFKETEFRRRHLEQENQDLLKSLKEFQESQIQEFLSASSLKKLRNKLRSLEQIHKECSANLRAREVEWDLQMEELTGDLNQCRLELNYKDQQIEKLQMELEGYRSTMMQLKLENEEVSTMLLVLKSGVSDSHLRLSDSKAEIERHEKDMAEKIGLLMEQLEHKNRALLKAQTEVKGEQEKTESLLRKIDSSGPIEHEYRLMQTELERYKEMLEELSGQQLRLKENALKRENDLIEDFRKVSDALDEANAELAGKTPEVNRLMDQLEKMNCALFKAHAEVKEEREKADSLLRKIDSIQHVEHGSILVQKELERYKEMLEESSRQQVHLKESALKRENDLVDDLRNVSDALDKANAELTGKILEENRLMDQLEKMNSALLKAHAEVKEEREKADSLLRKIDSIQHVEHSSILVQKELERYKEMLEESSRQQVHLKESALKRENDLVDDLRNVSDALDKANAELTRKILEENRLMDQLEKMNSALLKAHAEVKEEREKAESFLRKIDSLEHFEQKYLLVQEELEKYKGLLEELSGKQLRLKERAQKRKESLKDDLRKVSDDLDRANTELAEKTLEVQEIELGLESWKSLAERLKSCLDENQEMRREMEMSLLSQVEAEQNLKKEMEGLLHIVEEKDKIADDLKQQIVVLDEELMRTETEAVRARKELESKFEEEKKNLLQTMEGKGKRIDHLLQEIDLLEQEFLTRELESLILMQIVAEKNFDHEKERLLQAMEEKSCTIEEFKLKHASLEQCISSTAKLSVSALDEKQVEINALREAGTKLAAVVVLNEFDVQVKSLMITELEEQITNLWKNRELLEESVSQSHEREADLQSTLQTTQLEMNEMMGQFQNKLRASEGLIEKANSENGHLFEDLKKFSQEREVLLANIEGLCNKINEFSNEDAELMGRLGRIVQSFDQGTVPLTESEECDDFCDVENRNANILITCVEKKLEANAETRSPLKVRNSYSSRLWFASSSTILSLLSLSTVAAIREEDSSFGRSSDLPSESLAGRGRLHLSSHSLSSLSLGQVGPTKPIDREKLSRNSLIVDARTRTCDLLPVKKPPCSTCATPPPKPGGVPFLLWTGAALVCRALDPLILPSEASQAVKQRLLNFVRSLSTVLALAYCLSRWIQQTQKFFMESNDSDETRNMGLQFAGKAVHTAVWIAAISLFMELLGFSTQKWVTAGGLGTVLLTLAGREILTNFLSSIMIHATRPFVLNEWIQTKIEGYEVSGTVEHVGWWSPTIIRGDDREAVHIPNHKFTVNVVRNLSQKTHWRIKTHLPSNIVADMRKVLAKNPQVEQQKLHRRVFLDNVAAENQALMEAILLDLLRVISHHRARLATPIRTFQKSYSDADMENIPFSETIFNRRRAAAHDRFLLIEPSYKISSDEKPKAQAQTPPINDEQETKATGQPSSDSNSDDEATTSLDTQPSELKAADNKVAAKTSSDIKKDPMSIATLPSSKKRAPPERNSDAIAMVSDSERDPEVAASLSDMDKEASFSDFVKKNSDGTSKTPSSAETSKHSKVSGMALEDNIVLGVALDGSKRTLPIEDEDEKEEEMPTPTPVETKELAASAPSVKDSSGQIPASAGDHREVNL